jgi:chromosome segregation ATPase
MKRISENMKKMYEEKRAATIIKIQEAIDEIKEDRRIVTKKELMDLTGLSSGTFSQDHVKELLKSNEVCQYRNRRKVRSEVLEKNKSQKIDDLIIGNEKLTSKIQDYELALERLNNKYDKLNSKHIELESEHQLLRGKYQQLLEYLDAMGADLGSLPLI